MNKYLLEFIQFSHTKFPVLNSLLNCTNTLDIYALYFPFGSKLAVNPRLEKGAIFKWPSCSRFHAIHTLIHTTFQTLNTIPRVPCLSLGVCFRSNAIITVQAAAGKHCHLGWRGAASIGGNGDSKYLADFKGTWRTLLKYFGGGANRQRKHQGRMRRCLHI